MGGTGGLSAATALNPVSAGLSAIPAVYQMGLGIAQDIRARKMMKNAVRPTATVPQALLESMSLSRNAYMDGSMPGQQFAADQIAGNTAGAFRSIGGMGGGAGNRISAMLAANANANNAYGGLAAQSAAYQAQERQQLNNILGQVGAEQNRVWQYNEADPYAAIMTAAQREDDAANQNIYGSLKGLGGSIASTITNPGSVPTPSADATFMEKANAQAVIDAFSRTGPIGADGKPTAAGYGPSILKNWEMLNNRQRPAQQPAAPRFQSYYPYPAR